MSEKMPLDVYRFIQSYVLSSNGYLPSLYLIVSIMGI